MQPGTFDLIILIIIFISLQAWWVIPIIKKNNMINDRGKDIREEIKQLERIFIIFNSCSSFNINKRIVMLRRTWLLQKCK